MQNQLQTQETSTPQTTPIVTPTAELATEETTDTQAMQVVTNRLAELRRLTRRNKSRFFTSFLLLQSTLVLPVLLLAMGGYKISAHPVIAAILTCLMGFSILGYTAIRHVRHKPTFDADELARLGGVQAVGPLLDFLRSQPSLNEAKVAYAALTQLLPQMKASDAHLLLPQHRNFISAVLGNARGGFPTADYVNDFRVAALKALEQVGDEKAISLVERLAAMKGRTPATRRIKQAAIDCLPMLQANYGSAEANKSLLRASVPGEMAPETLLRPASSSTETASHQLLRAAQSSENTPPV